VIVNCTLYEKGRREESELSFEQAGAAAREPGAFVWLGVVEPTAEEFATIAREFDLHELAVEDAVNAHQRPKLERYGDTLLVVVKTARYIDPTEVIEIGEVLVFANPAFVITVRHGAGELAPVRERLDSRPDLLEHGVGMVLYSRSSTMWSTATRKRRRGSRSTSRRSSARSSPTVATTPPSGSTSSSARCSTSSPQWRRWR